MEERIRSREFIGKILISEESGKKFGIVGDVEYIVESGELLNILLAEPTPHARDMNLKGAEDNKVQVPFTAVKSVGDFVIVSEKDII